MCQGRGRDSAPCTSFGYFLQNLFSFHFNKFSKVQDFETFPKLFLFFFFFYSKVILQRLIYL